jgi:protein-disulfide isomerase-like protein with CxxC motif
VLAVHAALQECWPTLLLAYEEIRKVVGNSFGATLENYLKSNSSVYVVNAAACIVVLAAQSQAQVS